LDLITPVTDDPYIFGQIAAANSISDIYAMGAKAISALNICCFPEVGPAKEALVQIIQGSMDKCIEADVLVIGGHTVRDPELKFGLSVNGTVHPDKILRNCTPKPGEVLILTKPIGTGLLMTANAKQEVSEEAYKINLTTMSRLNRNASEIALQMNASAATDVTGFGLAGHLWEMLNPNKYKVDLNLADIPLFEGAQNAAAKYGLSKPMRKNLGCCGEYFKIDNLDPLWQTLLADPQTSGGLLIAVSANNAKEYCKRLEDKGEQAFIVGQVKDANSTNILV
jgi:selenide, water dikinase